jgi:hypothetical protein
MMRHATANGATVLTFFMNGVDWALTVLRFSSDGQAVMTHHYSLTTVSRPGSLMMRHATANGATVLMSAAEGGTGGRDAHAA